MTGAWRADMIGGVALFVISGVSAAGNRRSRGCLRAGSSEVSACRATLSARWWSAAGTRCPPVPVSGNCTSSCSGTRGLAVASVYLVPVPEFHLVFLDPDGPAIERREAPQRERGRDGAAYRADKWSVSGLRAMLREETERIGLWLDSTRLSAEQTVEAIVADLDASRVRLPLAV